VQKALAHLRCAWCGMQQTADLRGECISVTRAAAQRIAQPVFCQSCALMRRGIVVANARFPSRLQAGDRGLFQHDRAQIA
jgi:hypothetical protein